MRAVGCGGCALLLILLLGGCSPPERRGTSVEERRRQAKSAASEELAKGNAPQQPSTPPRKTSPPMPPPAPAEEKDPAPPPSFKAAGTGAENSSASPASPRAAGSPGKNSEVEKYLFELQSTPQVAGKAYRRLWGVPAKLIPSLLLEVDNPAHSGVKELPILVLEKEPIGRLDERTGVFTYRIRGMGNIYFDDIAIGKAPSGKGLRVKLSNFEGFPVGVVLRAALLNRFRSADFPAGDDGTNIVAWWQKYYQKVQVKL